MSRTGVPRALVTLGVVASLVLLVSCVQGIKQADLQSQDMLATLAPDVDTVQIHFVCVTVDSIGLTDRNGKPAWNVMRHPNQQITWVVAPTVTINAIKGKSGPLPIDVDAIEHGGTPGTSFKATVKNNAGVPGPPDPEHPKDKNYAYELDVTCTAGANSSHLVIDPEMIIRKP